MTLSLAATLIVVHSSHFVVLCCARLSEISFFFEKLFVECQVSASVPRKPLCYSLHSAVTGRRALLHAECISEVTSETPQGANQQIPFCCAPQVTLTCM